MPKIGALNIDVSVNTTDGVTLLWLWFPAPAILERAVSLGIHVPKVTFPPRLVVHSKSPMKVRQS